MRDSKARMRILIVKDGLRWMGLTEAWESHGYEVLADKWNLDELTEQRALQIIRRLKHQENCKLVFSIHFLAGISNACKVLGILYISWVVDSPHIHLFMREAHNSVNRIFSFDVAQCNMLWAHGYEHVYHLPCCVGTDTVKEIIANDGGKRRERYGSDVAFVGALYDQPPRNMYDEISYLSAFIRGYLTAAIEAQRLVWGENIVHKTLQKSVLDEIRKYVRTELQSEFEEGYYLSFLEGMIHKKIAQLERKAMCDGLAERFNFALYSGSDTTYNPRIQNRGVADYRKEMPLIFYYSKININITLHSIETGIPLRVMDILACGGFCLTNYQAEIAEYFEDGKDLVIYSDFEDMYDKIDYYLNHEEERKQIAKTGQAKVREFFDITDGVGRMIEVLKEEEK